VSQPRGNSEYPKDIEIAATEAIEFVEGMDSGDFTGDRKTIAAVVQKITVIGEAAYVIPGDIRRLAPEIQWQDMIDMRNKLVHDYYEIRTETVWLTVQDDLPPLISSIRRLLADLAAQGW
jgi:uncharacterized protein with HEPN domain